MAYLISLYATYSGGLGALDKSPAIRFVPNVFVHFTVLRANTGWYLTEKPVKWAETGGTNLIAGLLSKAPRWFCIQGSREYQPMQVPTKVVMTLGGNACGVCTFSCKE